MEKSKHHNSLNKFSKQLEFAYTGSVNVKKGPANVTTLKVNRSLSSTIQTNGSGIMTNLYSSADVVSVTDWASLQAVWKEYRVLAIEVQFMPIAASTAVPICVAIVGDHNANLSSLTSMDDAASYDNVKYMVAGGGCNITNGKFPRYTMKARGVDEIPFIPITSAPTSSIFGVKTYSTVGSNTTTYCEVTTKFLIEFQGSG